MEKATTRDARQRQLKLKAAAMKKKRTTAATFVRKMSTKTISSSRETIVHA